MKSQLFFKLDVSELDLNLSAFRFDYAPRSNGGKLCRAAQTGDREPRDLGDDDERAQLEVSGQKRSIQDAQGHDLFPFKVTCDLHGLAEGHVH